ncbi:hypothetical protein EC957_000654 [Mortierella hygrophila]|uniref:Uncharacterized protein n=1 Tax=Mortierella hygrophila TaxID=979708 RepID=A0A9P6FFW7_9FUNG|nr:hypothetical protein EC957_000654 [Mortierella hygrophila]
MAMPRNQRQETVAPIGALDALLDSIAATGELTDDHIMCLMHIMGQQGNITTTSVLGALRILDNNPGSA